MQTSSDEAVAINFIVVGFGCFWRGIAGVRI